MQKKREYPSIIIDIDIEVAQSCQLFVTPWTVACQAPLSMEFFSQGYGMDCHFLLQGSSWPRDQTYVACISCIDRQIFYH